MAYVWRLFDENIPVDRIIEPGRTICVGAKFVGEKAQLFSEWEHGHAEMLAKIHAMMSEADAIVTYNGDKFDLPILRGEFALAGMAPPAPAASVDVFKTIRTLKLGSSKLGYVGERFGVGEKMKHEGFDLWKGVMAGDAKAERKMGRYCVQDVRLLEDLYKRVLPYIRNHPHMVGQEVGACPSCGSLHVQRRGPRRTRTMLIQRMHCQDCGSWHDGPRTKVL
ncbi:ribonuclease H-like domain-containing protein [Alteriqipengyuania flavescens]|uniref:ribonuclease H-like domain-containing protein n=1 Tax=Alteriqipengyuania flavescens TaxID=3053610 RepID=UPI0025B57523|nr:ribonuclease H-like domain-containing protein [Alteriqipengyuania flavescens]WJY17659.1 ribonuclease H-like domain-containing protein [Alteriqipengyuania flavescens]WJY23602.1 ribonuclease H-like domain-containing protein [Alteriqipengyuania flavescens]